MIETLAYVVVLGLFGYSIGRLIAQETVFDPLRRPLLNWLGGPGYRMAAAEREAMGEGSPVYLDTRTVRGYIIDGLTCPSCVGFWATVAGFFLFDTNGWIDYPLTADIVLVFAAWALVGIFARTFK